MSKAAARITDDYEIILVNDGSPDTSLEIALTLLAMDEHLKVIDLSRNFGHHKAMMTGLGHASGDLVFLIDSDLDEDPELLATFLETLDATGADVVHGVQAERRGGWLERFSGWLFFKVFNLLSTWPIPENVITVRLMTRRYVSALVAHREREMTIAGLWAVAGFLQVPVPVKKHRSSQTTYSFGHKVAVLVNSITSFSDKPLIFIFYLGIVIICLASIAAAYLIIRRLFFGVLLSGWPSVMVSIWLLGGLTLFCLGIIGVYLSKIFLETKQRPYAIIRAIHERTDQHRAISADTRDSRSVLR